MPATSELPDIDQIIDDFEFLEDWEQRFGYVIDLGRKLTPMDQWPEHDLVDDHKVTGCQASVWLIFEVNRDGESTVHMRAVSDAHLVNGLIAILESLYNGKTPHQVLQADVQGVLKTLDLEEHLSPTRRNGLYAMIRRIRELAQAEKAAT